MEERFDKLEQMIGSLGTRMDAGFEDVNQRIGVLHEDVKSDIRFTLEARQALQEVMDTKFAEQERSFKEALAPIADAVRSSFRR